MLNVRPRNACAARAPGWETLGCSLLRVRAALGELFVQVLRLADGSLRTHDDQGFELSFQVTTRTPLDLPAERVNAPYDTQRPVNQVGVWEEMPAKPRTLSHVVLFVPDLDVAVNFAEASNSAGTR